MCVFISMISHVFSDLRQIGMRKRSLLSAGRAVGAVVTDGSEVALTRVLLIHVMCRT